MPQWQFKLFEFDVKDDYDKNIEYVAGKDNKRFIVQMFGIDESGKTASIFVKGFDPFFYVKVGDNWNNSDKMELVSYVKKELGSYYEDSLYKAKIVKRHKLYGFDDHKLYTFIQLKFKNTQALNKAKNLWFKDKIINGIFERKLIKGGIIVKDTPVELYETQIPPLLRMFHIQEISPSGWIALLPGSYTEHTKKTTTCDYEFSLNYKHIRPIPKKETRVPYKILSLDIEASSSHGDFPLPKKNYKKLATNIVDIITTTEATNELLQKCIYTAFGFDNYSDIDKVYTKKSVKSLDEIKEIFNEWIKVYPAKYAKMKELDNELKNQLIEEELKKAEEESDDELDKYDDNADSSTVETFAFKKPKKIIKKYTKKEATMLDMLNDPDAERETKIQELTNTLTIHFPEIEGDKITFIGSSLRLDGKEKPYLRHCIVVNTCKEINNAVVESYSTEKQGLLAWTAFIQRENPDIIIGYNIHGWDCGFMYERSKELNCTKQFLQLSRNKNEICLKKDWKTGKETIEENTLVIASGQYDIKYFKMTGRLQIDFLNLFRREYQLSSYKLDYVSGYFIGDIINEIIINKKEVEDGKIEITSTIKTKNLIGLENDDFIVIEQIGHTTDVYEGGKKFKINNLQKDSFDISGEICPDKTKTLRWCLGKDDVTPQDIFTLTNKGPVERAIVGKYCIKDTTLIHDLMRKNDTITGFIEMANICSVPINFLQMRGQGIKLTSFVAKKCREKNTLMPVIQKSDDEDGYEGATVLDPKTGLYLDNPVACVDYSSLYPSSIISENISHDSKVWTKEYDLNGKLLEESGDKSYDNMPGYEYVNITYDTFKWIRKTPKAAKTKELAGYKTCRFIQFKEGKAILPAILEELLAARKATKKLMKNEKDPYMANILDKRQLSIKVTANSLYGQSGARTSSFYEKDVAASTTATGRKLLMYAKAVVENAYGESIQETKKYGKVKTNAEYIYGDTDSVFFTFNLTELDGTKIIGKKALEITIDLAQEAGALATKFLKAPHDLEYEKTFLPFCLLSKKRYVGMLHEFDPEKGKRKSMGIVLKRRDNAPIVKDIYGGVIDILMNEKVVHKAVVWVKDCLQNMVDEKYSRDKLVITKSLRSNYKNPMQIAHNVLAKRIGEREPGNKPGPGDRIPFIYIKSSNKRALQGEKIENPKYILENNLNIDYGFYITNQIMKPLQQVFALVLEEMLDFRSKRGRQDKNNPHGSWKKDIDKLREKWTDEDKFKKKYEEFRCKEVKNILFDEYIKQVK